MVMGFAKIDHFGCRSFGPTPTRIFDVGAQHDCVGRNLEVPVDQMNLKHCVSFMANEKLGRVLDVYLVYFCLLRVIQKLMVPIKS